MKTSLVIRKLCFLPSGLLFPSFLLFLYQSNSFKYFIVFWTIDLWPVPISIPLGLFIGASLMAQSWKICPNAGAIGSVPGLGRSSGEGNSNLLQYSCLENSMNRGAGWATAHGSQRIRHSWTHTHNTFKIIEHSISPVYFHWLTGNFLTGLSERTDYQKVYKFLQNHQRLFEEQ